MVQASDFYQIIASSNEFCGSAIDGPCMKVNGTWMPDSWLKSLPASERFAGDIYLPEGMYDCMCFCLAAV